MVSIWRRPKFIWNKSVNCQRGRRAALKIHDLISNGSLKKGMIIKFTPNSHVWLGPGDNSNIGEVVSADLHRAIMWKYLSHAIASSLIQIYPNAFQMPDHDGNLPVHLAEDPEAAHVLLIGFPPGLYYVENNKRCLPLLEICSNSDNESLAEVFLGNCTMSLCIGDKSGNLPLHLAIMKCSSLESIQLLTNEFPGALSVSNIHGALPLHLTCSMHNSMPNVAQIWSMAVQKLPIDATIIVSFQFTGVLLKIPATCLYMMCWN